MFFDNRDCNRIRLANRIAVRLRFGGAAHGDLFTSLCAKGKSQFPPSAIIRLDTHSSLRRCNNENAKQKGTDMEYCTTIGIDVSDGTSRICMMTKVNGERRVIEEKTVKTSKAGFREYLADKDRSVPIAFETGTHCRWMRDLMAGELGFRVYVANPGKLPTITKSNTKNDRNDARELARLLLADPEMLHPVELRGEAYQTMIRYAKARDAAMGARTKFTNMIRGFAKAMGERIEDCEPEKFVELNRSEWPTELRNIVLPLVKVLKETNAAIRRYEKMMRNLAKRPEFKDKVERVQEVYGVGDIIGSVFVAVIGGDVSKFTKARDVGPLLGFTPKQDQSGTVDKQLHATKAGDKLMRRLLVEGANVVLKRNSRDTDLKLRGLRISLRGGKIAKAKAKIAVARGLAVTMTALLMKPDMEYVPLSDRAMEELALVREEMARREAAKSGKKKTA